MKNNKSLGQHWLKNRAILEEIAELALSTTADSLTCLEIGPGLGTLTSSLLRRFSSVVAVEFDPLLAHNLPASFPGKALTVINDDILQVDLTRIISPPFVVAGNIPYYITSPIISKLLSATPAPQKIVLLIQKEVAERLGAHVGDLSFFALEVQNLAEVELGPVVPAAEFTPPPKVDSQVIILTPREQPLISREALALARVGFSAPRKKLVHNLAGTRSKDFWREALISIGQNPDARPADLSHQDWQRLASV